MSGNPWNKLSTFKEIIWSRKWACQICWCHKTYSFVSTPSTAISGSFLWSSRNLLDVHHWIFMSWALQFAQNLFLRVDSASCWYNWLFQEGFLRKEKLSKFGCIWPLKINTRNLWDIMWSEKCHFESSINFFTDYYFYHPITGRSHSCI